MADKDRLVEAAKGLQNSLTKASLSQLQRVLCGLEFAPEGVQIETELRGGFAPGMQVKITHPPSANTATLSIVGNDVELRSVTVDEKKCHRNQQSSPAEEKEFKDAIEKLTQTCPEIGSLIVGSNYSRSGDKVVAPTPEQPPAAKAR